MQPQQESEIKGARWIDGWVGADSEGEDDWRRAVSRANANG
jgi:hypothetical protein